MELEFKKTNFSCLRECLLEVQNGEETLEIRIPDGSGDIGRVLAAWGQPVLRGKEWRDRQIGISCGMMVWVLYYPEEEAQLCCLEGWIPYQFHWDLPQGTAEGTIRASLSARFVDARSVSPRKIMVRSGMAVMLQALTSQQCTVRIPQAADGVEMLKKSYPVRYMKESGERTFQITESLKFPPSVPPSEQICYYCVTPEVTEQKMVGSRVVFKGNLNLHLLYKAEGGQLYTWDFPLPFSQYGQLEEAPLGENWVDVKVCPVNLELSQDDEGYLQLKASVTAQYLLEERGTQVVAVDAYCPGKAVTLRQEQLEVPVVLDSRWERLSGEREVSGDANVAVDTRLMTDYPSQKVTDGRIRLEIPHSLQILYYGEKGQLQTAASHWTSHLEQVAAEDCRIMAFAGMAVEPHVLPGGDAMSVQWEVPIQLRCTGNSHIPMLSALELGEEIQPKEDGPSLLLMRSGEQGLWELAKQTGSRQDAIRMANDLQGEPEPGQLLLIPLNG